MNTAFLKLLPKFMSRVDIDGIRFLPTNKTERIKTYDGKVIEGPVFKLWNSKNVPFSYNSLADLLTLELEELGKIVSANIGYNEIEKFIKIDNLEKNQYYIPNNLIERFKYCVDGVVGKVKQKSYEVTIHTEVRYIIDQDFDFYWEDSESFRIDISVEVLSVFIENNITGTREKVEEKIEMQSYVYDIASSDSYTYEAPIWQCVPDIFTEHETFLNTDWQYVTINIIPK
jgi:hypothetical protein